MPRSIASPTAPATRKASGSAIASDQSNRPGAGRADDVLHDEGGVGAEHHHLAMRHVDDAHDAEGDGEADRRQQQHRAERDAVPDVLAGGPQRQRRSSILAIAAEAASFSAPSELASIAGQQRQRLAVAARGDQIDRRELFGLGQIGHQHGGSARLLEPGLDAGIGLLGDRRVERWDGRRVGRAEHRLGGGEPHGGIVAIRASACPAASRMTRAQAVVDLDLGDVRLWRLAGLRAGQRVGELDRLPGLLADEDGGCRICGNRDCLRPAPPAAARRTDRRWRRVRARSPRSPGNPWRWRISR